MDALQKVDLAIATDIAIEYIKKAGHLFTKVIRAKHNQEDQWIIEIDVGIYKPDIKKITIDAFGGIIGYE